MAHSPCVERWLAQSSTKAHLEAAESQLRERLLLLRCASCGEWLAAYRVKMEECAWHHPSIADRRHKSCERCESIRASIAPAESILREHRFPSLPLRPAPPSSTGCHRARCGNAGRNAPRPKSQKQSSVRLATETEITIQAQATVRKLETTSPAPASSQGCSRAGHPVLLSPAARGGRSYSRISRDASAPTRKPDSSAPCLTCASGWVRPCCELRRRARDLR